MRVLSLFSGIGAHDLGLEWAGYEIVGQIENDEYCQKILKKHWQNVPKWCDIKKVSTDEIKETCGQIDLIAGGFPCQDISTAGKQAGIEGEKSGLWREMWRIVNDLRPSWVLLENVPALRTNGADTVLSALEESGYSCWSIVVGAVHVGAPHERRRVWIVAQSRSPNSSKSLSDPDSDNIRIERGRLTTWQEAPFTFPSRFAEPQYKWEHPRTIESEMGGAVDGTPRRMARLRRSQLKAIGNANPPQIPYLIGLAIKEVMHQKDLGII